MISGENSILIERESFEKRMRNGQEEREEEEVKNGGSNQRFYNQQTPTQINFKTTQNTISNLKKENFDLKIKIHFLLEQQQEWKKQGAQLLEPGMAGLDASFAAIADDGEDGEDGELLMNNSLSMDRLSLHEDPTTDGQEQDQLDLQQQQHEMEMENMKSEFMIVAQQACDDIQELHDRIAQQQEEILLLQKERDHHARQALLLSKESASAINMKSDFGVQTDTFPAKARTISSQTIRLENKGESTQTIASLESCHVSCQTEERLVVAPTPKPIMLLPDPNAATSHSRSSSQLAEYERNKQRFIDELKERNSLLIRIVQFLDGKLGCSHVGRFGGVSCFLQLFDNLFRHSFSPPVPQKESSKGMIIYLD